MKEKTGSTSVLLMVLLATMLLLIGTVTEAASRACGGSYVQGVSELAGRSVLSMYDKDLKREYGLFGVCATNEELQRQFAYYVDGSLKKKDKKPFIDGLEMEGKEHRLYGDSYALTNMDQLEKQIADFMRYRWIGDFALEHHSSEAMKRLQDAAENMEKGTKDLVQMEKNKEWIEESYEIFEKADDLMKDTADLKPSWEQWNRCVENGEAEQASKLKEQLERRWDWIQEEMGRLSQKISKLEKRLDGTDAVQKKQGEELVQVRRELQRREQISVERLPVLFEESEQNAGQSFWERFRLRRLIRTYRGKEITQGEEERSNRVLRNNRIKEQLPSVLLLDDSTGSFMETEKRTRKQTDQWAGTKTGSYEVAGERGHLDPIQKLYTVSYIDCQCRQRMSEDWEKTSFFQQEVEYLLVGSYSDLGNAKRMEHRLFALRTAANLVHIYSDQTKRTEIRGMAATLTPGPGAVVTEFLLAMAWSCGESRMDMEALLDGQGVPLMKNNTQWTLGLGAALSGRLPKMPSSEEKGKQAGSKKEGLTYGEYLQLFLFGQDREVQLCRLMDLIQINMQGLYWENFTLQQCYGGFRTESQFLKKKSFGYGRKNGKPATMSMVMCHEY